MNRALDVSIAQQVMGCKLVPYRSIYPKAPDHMEKAVTCGCPDQAHREDDTLKRYSSDIRAAFQVVAKMQEHPEPRKRTLSLRVYPYARTHAVFGDWDFATWSEANGDEPTAHAICKAALVAMVSK